MVVLDTDYLTIVEWASVASAKVIREELARRGELLTTTVINFEEQMRGWMSYVAACKTMSNKSRHIDF